MEKSNDSANEDLSKDQIERYCRQIILPEITSKGQMKIQNSRVLVIGAGGLGSSCLLYLAGAGVGTIGIVDGDTVETNNLHRQVIHHDSNKGQYKVESAKKAINSYNPLVQVKTFSEHFSKENCISIAKDYDIIVDCTDNPRTRYMISDVAVLLGSPLISGAAIRMNGQLTVLVRNSTKTSNHSCRLPCYRCLFPIPSPSSVVGSCSGEGVFGPVPGLIGTLQATETIKVILESEGILSRRMLIYDAWETRFKVFKTKDRMSDCFACGDSPLINLENIKDFDYEEFVSPSSCKVKLRVEVDPKLNLRWKDYLEDKSDGKLIIDVRSRAEFDLFNLSKRYKTVNFPLDEISKTLAEEESEYSELLQGIKSGKENIYIMCRAGNNSTHAVKILSEKGFSKILNLQDGLHGYIQEVDKDTPYY